MTIPIAIAHAHFLPERRAFLDKMLAKLPGAHVSVSERKEHARIWAVRLWQWCAEHDDAGVICLNDDVDFHPDLAEIVSAMARAVPDTIFALHTNAQQAPMLMADGHRWFRSYWLTGPAYYLPPGVAARLLAFVDASSLVWGGNEDVAAAHFAWHEQKPIWHSLPAFVQHDVSVPSTLGYDHHPLRQSGVPWFEHQMADDTWMDPAHWKEREPPVVVCPFLPHDHLSKVERTLELGVPMCIFCMERPGHVMSQKSGASICRECVGGMMKVAR